MSATFYNVIGDLVLFRRGATGRRLLLLGVLFLLAAIAVPKLTRVESPMLNDGHALAAMELAFTRTFCGTGSFFPAQYRLPHHVRDHPELRFTPLRDVAGQIAGSLDQYCFATNHPFINNENSLTTVMHWLLSMQPDMSLVEMGTWLHRIRLAALTLFAAVAVWAGLSVGAAAFLVLLALDGLRSLDDLNYSLYPFLAPMIIVTAALYTVSAAWLARGGWRAAVPVALLGGMLTAFIVNLRTSYLPVVVAMFALMLVAAWGTWRTRAGLQLRECAARVAGMAVLFVAGYVAMQYGTISRHLPKDVAQAAHHTVAHPLILSLAVPDSELSRREGIRWEDGAGLALAQKMIPDATYLGPTYDQALFMYYRSLWANYPGEMLHIYWSKFGMAGMHLLGSVRDDDGLDGLMVRYLLLPQSLLQSGVVLLAVCGVLCVGGVWTAVRRQSPLALLVALLSGSAVLLLVESAIIMPRYTPAYHGYLVWYLEFTSVLALQGIVVLIAPRHLSTTASPARKTATYFDAISDDFHERMNPFDLGARLEWFDAEFQQVPMAGARVLDVGAGLGQFSHAARRHGPRVVVPLDIAPRLVRRARESLPAAMCGSATQLPFSSATFDVVISSECIEHTPDPEAAVREMLRVLRPNGMLLLTTPNLVWRWSIGIAEAIGIRNFEGIENWLSRRALRRALEESGGTVVRTAGLHILPFQFRALHPLLRFMNHKGQWARAVMINQCWVARRTPPA